MLWHGWSDPALTALGTIKYYEQVQARDTATRDYARLFMMPGVPHCAGDVTHNCAVDVDDLLLVIANWAP